MRKINKSSTLFLILFLVTSSLIPFGLIPSGLTQTSVGVSGIISQNTTWTKANSPYTLSGNVLINHTILNIEAGTSVNLNGYCIEINGTIVAKGTETNPITLENGYQSEKGIIFDPTSNNWNENSNTGSIIEGAILDSVGIFVQGAEPKINRNLFYNSGKYTTAPYAIFILGPSSNPTMVISNNTFGSGYTLSAIEISQPPTPIIVGNNFIGKSAYNIDLWYYTPDVEAINNWWGTTDPEAINKTINDFYDNFQFGKVTFVPFLTQPNPKAPAYTTSPTPSPNPTMTPTPIPVPNQSFFFVESNSTVTELFFNSTNSELSFTVSGPPDTTGYVKVTIAKSLVTSVQNVKVYLDGQQLNVAITSNEDYWLLNFDYTHSTHHVTVSLNADTTAKQTLSLDYRLLTIIIITIAVATSILFGYIKLAKRKPD